MPRILVMEGNTLARQREAAKLGVHTSSGIYVDAIAAHFPDLDIDVINAADRGQSPPSGMALEDYDGLVIGGSGLHAYDDTFEVRNQIDLLVTYAQTGKPILGSCWGLQIAVIAAGGTVGLSPNGREIGFARKVLLNEAGRAHPFFAGKPVCFDAPCIHYDEIASLPSNTTLLCSNAHSEVQAAIVPVGASEVWAVQYHPEYALEHISMVLKLYADDMVEQGFFDTVKEFDAYMSKIDQLAENPAKKSIAWQLGVDSDVLNAQVRRMEIINWVNDQIYGIDR